MYSGISPSLSACCYQDTATAEQSKNFRKSMLLITNETRKEQEVSKASCTAGGQEWRDFISNAFFSDNERYADIINGIGCNGIPFVKGKDLPDEDAYDMVAAYVGEEEAIFKWKEKNKKDNGMIMIQ